VLFLLCKLLRRENISEDQGARGAETMFAGAKGVWGRRVKVSFKSSDKVPA